MFDLPNEYQHEPKLGLAAGIQGLDFAMRILREAHAYLKQDGILIVEVGNSEHALAENYPEIPFTWLEFQRSDGGVFILTAEQLTTHKEIFRV
jgi:ribosomal protein L3 glutamine methyltransferase